MPKRVILLFFPIKISAMAKKNKASLIIVNKDFDIKMYKSLNFLCVEDSYLAFNQLLQLFNQVKKNQPEISEYSLVQVIINR